MNQPANFEDMEISTGEDSSKTVLARIKSDTGELLCEDTLDLPINITVKNLQSICDTLLKNEDPVPLAFFINDIEMTGSLIDSLGKDFSLSENIVDIVYQPQAVFKVRSVTRCTGSIEGHKEAVISVAFSPDGENLASGSGDATVRLWDISTQTPQFTCSGHKNWVLCISWSPCGKKLISGCKNGTIIQWDPETGKQIGRNMTGHKNFITALAWEPYHQNCHSRYFVSSSKDCDLRIWDSILGQTTIVLAGHTKSVTCVKWGGNGLIYSGSQDKTIRVWRAKDGVLCRTLIGHAHWINSLALNVDYVLRTGPFELFVSSKDEKDPCARALKRYKAIGEEILISGSDDYTLHLWKPEKDKKSLQKMTGHQQLINDVKFSPDGRIIASASFDKSIKLWEGMTGKFISTLRGHVQAVYTIAWSADSRLLVSGSSDSTLKVWSMKTKKLAQDLPGHADEIYGVDWAPNGLRVVSGGKDKVLRLWQN